MGIIILAILILAATAIVTSITGNPDDTLWVLLAAPVAIPLGFAVLVTIVRLLKGPRR
jgi:cytochrome bd-type quinol oxidase subunit 1